MQPGTTIIPAALSAIIFSSTLPMHENQGKQQNLNIHQSTAKALIDSGLGFGRNE